MQLCTERNPGRKCRRALDPGKLTITYNLFSGSELQEMLNIIEPNGSTKFWNKIISMPVYSKLWPLYLSSLWGLWAVHLTS